MPRKRIGIGRVAVAAVSVVWLAYAVALDVRYRRFPEVLLGAAQILLGFYLLLGIATLVWRGARRVVRGSREADR